MRTLISWNGKDGSKVTCHGNSSSIREPSLVI